MIIYYTHKYGSRKGESHRLLQQAISRFLTEKGYGEAPAENESRELVSGLETSGEFGKPCIAGFAPFSISHSSNTWAVLISGPGDETGACGLDIQYRRKTEAVSVAERFYAAEDAVLVSAAMADGGADAAEDVFFRLWTRREALVKAAGVSVAGTDIPAVNRDAAVFRDTEYSIADVRIPGDGLYAAVCTSGRMLPVRTAEL